MKISKTQLKQLIGCSGACDWNCDPYKEEKYEHFKSSVLNSLWDGTLEIDGYSQDKWTEFYPDDPKTFPPMYESVLFLVYWKHFDPSMRIGFYNNVEFQDEMGHYIRAFSKILWRPLPKPPVETEAQKWN